MRAAIALIAASLLGCANADDSPKRACSSTLKGDYQFEACGAFCKEAKKGNHCKFCKCKACTFCAAGAAGAASAVAAPPALSPRNRSPPPPRWPKKGGKKGGKAGGMGGTGAPAPLGGAGKPQCKSGIKGDLPFMTCAAFCKSSKATNHCKFCKCRSCQYCAKDGAPAAGAAAAATAAPAGAPAGASVSVSGSSATLTSATDGMQQRGVPVDRVASRGASHARLLQGVGVAILLVLVGLGMVAFTSQGDAEMGTWRHTLQTHLAKMGLASHGVEGNRLNREEEASDLDAAFRAVDKLEAEVALNKR